MDTKGIKLVHPSRDRNTTDEIEVEIPRSGFGDLFDEETLKK